MRSRITNLTKELAARNLPELHTKTIVAKNLSIKGGERTSLQSALSFFSKPQVKKVDYKSGEYFGLKAECLRKN